MNLFEKSSRHTHLNACVLSRLLFSYIRLKWHACTHHVCDSQIECTRVCACVFVQARKCRSYSSSVIFLAWLCCVPGCCTVGEYQCSVALWRGLELTCCHTVMKSTLRWCGGSVPPVRREMASWLWHLCIRLCFHACVKALVCVCVRRWFFSGCTCDCVGPSALHSNPYRLTWSVQFWCDDKTFTIGHVMWTPGQ